MTRGTTTSVTARYLVEALREAGHDVADWSAEAGLTPGALASPDLRLPLTAFDALWARATAHDPTIGLRLVERFPPGQMHLVAHLAMRAPTLGEAIRDIVRFAPLTDPEDRIDGEIVGDRAVLGYRHPGLESGSRSNPGFVEHLLGMAHWLFTRAVGRPLPLREVRFAAGPLARPGAYLERFGLQPRFGMGVNELHYAAEALAWPLATRDDYLRDLLARLASDRLPPVASATWTERLTIALRRRWLDGQPLDLAGAAAMFGIQPATLRSRLAAEGTGFRALADTTRREVARLHLAGPMSLGEIAHLLRFSEPAAFHHAVRRWFGASAGDVRARLATGREP